MSQLLQLMSAVLQGTEERNAVRRTKAQARRYTATEKADGRFKPPSCVMTSTRGLSESSPGLHPAPNRPGVNAYRFCRLPTLLTAQASVLGGGFRLNS